ncbi:hypothetical protein [Arcobacter sp. YIC-310]|uniref:hypothetical protein n=1 Tax=Arcobacter sp. YIC-310 TaxID=3376632 RepID=UPI003C2459F7
MSDEILRAIKKDEKMYCNKKKFYLMVLIIFPFVIYFIATFIESRDDDFTVILVLLLSFLYLLNVYKFILVLLYCFSKKMEKKHKEKINEKREDN